MNSSHARKTINLCVCVSHTLCPCDARHRFKPALATMWADRVNSRFPFGSLVPLWTRQIPYTVTKFVGFEYVVEQFYKHVLTNPRDSYSSATQLGVTFASGCVQLFLHLCIPHPCVD